MQATMSQPIPIASSSKAAQDPHSTPRPVISPYPSASPSTYRPASFGHRFYSGTSPAQFGTMAIPEFKPFLSSSYENEHDSLIRSLSGGDVMSMQEDMCRNYTCCGLDLPDLHALVEHFEDAHVVVLDEPDMSRLGGPDVTGGAFDVEEMEMDMPPTPPAFTPTSVPGTPAFSTTSVLSRRSSHMFAPYPSPTARPRMPRLGDISPVSDVCIPPALLFSPSASPSPLNTPAASRGASPEPASPETSTPPPTATKRAAAQASQQTQQPAMKPFRCPKPGCNKSYKQSNGLKYHITHGQCNFAPRDPNVDDHKPYLCQVGCNKRFKNMSGLRYHYQHTAEHGRIGLALLQAGQLPSLG